MLAEYDHSGNQETTIAEVRTMTNEGYDSIRLQDLRNHAKND